LTKDILALPKMHRHRLELDPLSPTEQAAIQRELHRIDHLREHYGQRRGDAALLQLCHQQTLQKVPHVLPILATREQRCIVFFHHRDVGQAYRTWMEETGKSFVYIDGQTSTSERCQIIQTWKEDPSIVFGLFSLCATSTGLNLQFCTEILCVELTFHAAHHIQSEARIHRLGQTQEVHITYIIQPGTPDDMLWGSLNRKMAAERHLFRGDDDLEEVIVPW
jgi:SNF2 family DNA or RNA helicase